MERKSIVYWATTGLFCAVLGFSGVAHSTRLEPMVEAMTGLGYPLYFMTILGIAKLCGVVALLAPGRPLLKEWAYAGFTFNLTGAAASHLFVGDPLSEFLPPVVLLGLGAASYFLRPDPRRLPRETAEARGSLGARQPSRGGRI
jgi:hypothetical protein